MVMALDELADVLPDERYAPGRNDEEIGKSISIFLYKQKEEIRRVFLLKYFYFESNIAIAERCGFTERKALMFLHSLLVWLQVTICIQTILQDFFPRSYAVVWFGFTSVSPLLAFICWYTKGKGKVAFILSALILAVLFNMCFLYGFGYFSA